MSNEPNINDIGAQVKALIVDMKRNEGVVEQTRKLAQPLLRQVWDALENGETVAQCKSKTEFAKYAGVSMRYCQFILKDGSRKRSDANRVRSFRAYPVDIDFHNGRLIANLAIEHFSDDGVTLHDVSGDLTVWVESKNRAAYSDYLPVLGEKVKSTLRQLRLWTKEFTPEWRQVVTSYMESLPKSICPSNDLTAIPSLSPKSTIRELSR